MWIKVLDGQLVQATYFIRAEVITVDVKARKRLPYQIEPDGIVVYPGQDHLEAERTLAELGIPFNTEVLAHDKAHIEKAKGIKYASRSEAMKHLQDNEEPESQVIQNLKKSLQEKEVELAEIKSVLKAKGFMK